MGKRCQTPCITLAHVREEREHLETSTKRVAYPPTSMMEVLMIAGRGPWALAAAGSADNNVGFESIVNNPTVRN
jgi:hypothetical protein